MQCHTCKYFAVPLTAEEKKTAHCPGANPNGPMELRICVLQTKSEYAKDEFNPLNCKYHFPKFLKLY